MFHFHQHTTALQPNQDLDVQNKICLYEFIFDMYQQDDSKNSATGDFCLQEMNIMTNK